MSVVEVPQEIQPLGPQVSDMDVINGKPEAPPLISDSNEAKILLQIVKDYDRQEEFARYALVKQCRKQINYWNGLQYIAYDEVAHDWRSVEDIIDADPTSDIDPALHAKVVNIYKAHGEIFIGALTSGIPAVRFFPEDADVADDVMAAKAKGKLAELIQKHNQARLLLMKSLYILFNQGMVACYNENKADFRFGQIKTPTYANVTSINRAHFCASCGADLGQSYHDPNQLPEVQPQQCPQCGFTAPPEVEHTEESERIQTGETTEPKNRECLEIYGPLNVKFPLWCQDQFSTPYLILETEEHVALLREIYYEYANQIQASAYPDNYDKEARISTSYKNDFPRDLVTVQRVWLRPWALNIFTTDEPTIKALKEQYPEGLYVVILNGTLVVEIVKDSLDARWTISFNPLAETLHGQPIGAPLVPLQDITNEIANLTVETIEFGIPETFADGRVLDFDSYQRQEARPGQISQATAPSGQNLSSGFFELRAAPLSREVDQFAERITQAAQFVQGTYPSIYGGAQEKSGGTAREYELSKASALQRLSSTWIVVQEWWAKIMSKAVESFIQNMQEDEKHVQSNGANFLNVWIRRSELQGQTGRVEPEIAENFPISWAQKRDVILNLMQMKDEKVMAVITHPENAGLIASIIGVSELYIPGDDDRNKQLLEISELIQMEPQQGPPNEINSTGLISSIPVSVELDNHEIEAEICKAWLKSPVGLDAKKTNPAGYANVLAHLKEHLFFVQQAAMEQQQKEAQASGQDGKINDKGLAKPNGPSSPSN